MEKTKDEVYGYDKTEVKMIGNKGCVVRVRANVPSEIALDNHAKVIKKLLNRLKREGRLI